MSDLGPGWLERVAARAEERLRAIPEDCLSPAARKLLAALPCEACDLDRHACPGCGRGLGHGVTVCLRCRNHPDGEG